MPLPSHKCPITGCPIQVAAAHVMCVKHWRLVSAPIRDAVWREYRLKPGSPGHLAAVKLSIESANKMLAVLPS
jgi:hypothetical protein